VIDILQPGWLAVGAAAALAIWWLHRFHHRGGDRIVSAAFLWREQGAPDPRGHLQRPVDRRWWMRALVAFLLALALARPTWTGSDQRVVDVWIDDSQSLATIEYGSSRAAAATDLLVQRLADTNATSARVHSLTTPGRTLELKLGRLSDARAALSDWIRPRARAAQLPLPAEMDPAAEHWLVTDGADASLAAWAASVPLRHVVTVGSEAENVAVTCDGARAGRVVAFIDGLPAGESDITTPANGVASVAIELTSDRPGNHELTAVLDVQGDPQSANNTWRSMIAIDGPKPILIVSPDGESSPLAHSLLGSGRKVHLVAPERLAGDDRILSDAGVVMLDDIAIGDAPEVAWAALAESVETGSTGLIVLGGPRSFGASGYRGSRLEAVLPVTAEPRGPVPRAAVLFLVDKSGSMEQDHRGVSRIAHARRAVRVTADSLGNADVAGLMWFDRGPGDAISLRPKTAFLSAFDDVWTVAPSGGTTLVPGFRAALDRLSKTDADQRLLVLVTDGITPPGEDITPLRRDLADTGVSLIALVVGENRQVSGLQALAATNDGVFLRIDDVARLPSLMRTEVGARRSAWRSGPVVPREAASLPFLGPVGDWPTLGGYAVTTLRPAAREFLRSGDGDPLLAEHHVGLARVVALPGGLGGWARNWVPWREWGRFIGGLVAWTETAIRSPYADVAATDRPDGIAFRVDAVDTSYAWDSAASVTATVADPLGDARTIQLDLTAPGRFEGVAVATQPGRYTWTTRVGNQSISGALIRGGQSERAGVPATSRVTEGGADAPIPWSPKIALATARDDAAATPIRSYLVVCTLMTFVVLLVHERVGMGVAWSMVRERIRAWASRREPRNTNAGVR